MTPASQGSLTQHSHKDPKQNCHIIIVLWELVRLPFPSSASLLLSGRITLQFSFLLKFLLFSKVF